MSSSIKISDKFEPLFEEKTRYYIITGERGSSKSFTVNLWLTLKMMQINQTALFTRFTLSSAKDSIIPEFNEKINILNLEDSFDIQTHDISSLRNNSKILFRGIKTSQGIQTAKLKSLTNVNIWVVDEAEELADEEVFDKIDLSVRSQLAKNIVILILNPSTRSHWIYKRFFRGKVKENFNGVKGNITYIHTTLEDNIDNLDGDLVRSLLELKKSDPQKYKKAIAASWLDESEEIVFNESKLNYFKKVDFKDASMIAWCDVADQGTDFLCFLIGAIIGNNVFIIDVLFTRKDSNYTYPKIIQLIDKYNISQAWFESNGQGLMFSKLIMNNYQGSCKIKAIPNTVNKHSRIVIQSDYILENFHFRNIENKMYNDYLDNLTEYRNDKSVKNDDAPDATAGLSFIIRKLRLI